MGCIYAGFDYKNRVNGYFKIGETGKKLPHRDYRQLDKTIVFSVSNGCKCLMIREVSDFL